MKNAAILLAAGSSRRMRGSVEDKALTLIAGKPVFLYSVEAFLATDIVRTLAIVHRDEDQRSALNDIIRCRIPAEITIVWVPGGRERQYSVMNGLEALHSEIEIVFIHDCARPLVQARSLIQLEELARADGAACLAHRVSDTIKAVRSDSPEQRRCSLEDLERERLWAMETPQVFKRDLIADSYRQVIKDSRQITDDAAAAVYGGHKVTLLENRSPNPKITRLEDISYAEFLLGGREI